MERANAGGNADLSPLAPVVTSNNDKPDQDKDDKERDDQVKRTLGAAPAIIPDGEDNAQK